MMPTTHTPPPLGPPDGLKQRYLQASAEQSLRPSDRVRQAVLAHAAMVAAGAQAAQPHTMPSPRTAANRWNFSLVASIAIAAIGSLLALQWERGDPQDKQVALATPPVAAQHPAPGALADKAANSSIAEQATQPAPESAAKPPANKPVKPAPRATAPPLEPAAPAANSAKGEAPAPRSATLADAPPPAALKNRTATAAVTAEAIATAPAKPGQALREAARTGQIDQLELALQQTTPAQINEPGSNGQTALMLAARGGHIAVVQRLLDAGADPRLQDAKGQTAAQTAEQLGFAAIRDLLNKQAAGQ